jgi:hypothetical protein
MRRPRWPEAVAVCAVAVLVIALLLAFVLFPPLPNGETKIGSRTYFVENETVFGPAYSNYTFHGVRFSFHVWCSLASAGLGGAQLCGNVTEPSRTSYPFNFTEPGGAPPVGSLPWQTWVTPNGSEAVQFEPDSGGQVNLLVAL